MPVLLVRLPPGECKKFQNVMNQNMKTTFKAELLNDNRIRWVYERRLTNAIQTSTSWYRLTR